MLPDDGATEPGVFRKKRDLLKTAIVMRRTAYLVQIERESPAGL